MKISDSVASAKCRQADAVSMNATLIIKTYHRRAQQTLQTSTANDSRLMTNADATQLENKCTLQFRRKVYFTGSNCGNDT